MLFTLFRVYYKAIYICLIAWICHSFAVLKTYFGLLFRNPLGNPMFPLFLRPLKKLLDPNGPHISTFQTKIRNVCQARLQPTLVYLDCRGLYFFLKLRYIILVYPNVVCFSKLFVWVGRKHCPMSENSITKMNGICVWQHITPPSFHRMYV